MDNNGAKELHDRLLAMAKFYHQFCIENKLNYYMLGGTMLGAVRHQGFIPWDDDMDFGMPRSDYQRFVQLAANNLPYPYEIKYFGNTAESPVHYLKLIDCSTTLIEDSYHNYIEGLYIDIFPLDGADDSTSDKIRFHRITMLERLITNHCTTREKKSLWRKAFKAYSKTLNLTKLHNKMEKLMTKKNLESTSLIANYLGAWGKKEIMTKEVMGDPKQYQFEDAVFYGAQDAQSYLSSLYGNYMELPPAEKRVFRHNYYYLDYNYPYRKYMEDHNLNKNYSI